MTPKPAGEKRSWDWNLRNFTQFPQKRRPSVTTNIDNKPNDPQVHTQLATTSAEFAKNTNTARFKQAKMGKSWRRPAGHRARILLEHDYVMRPPNKDVADAKSAAVSEGEHALALLTDPSGEPITEQADKKEDEQFQEEEPANQHLNEPNSNYFSDPADDAVNEPYCDLLGDPLSDPLEDPLGDPLKDPLEDPLGDPLDEETSELGLRIVATMGEVDELALHGRESTPIDKEIMFVEDDPLEDDPPTDEDDCNMYVTPVIKPKIAFREREVQVKNSIFKSKPQVPPILCKIKGCPNESSDEGVKFYRIPSEKNSKRRKMWLEAIGSHRLRGGHPFDGHICGAHFPKKLSKFSPHFIPKIFPSAQLKCSVLGCKAPNKTLYKLPKEDLDRRSVWLNALCFQEGDVNDLRVCSAHFAFGRKSDDPTSPSYAPTLEVSAMEEAYLAV